MVILQSSFYCKGDRSTNGLWADADFEVAGSKYGSVTGSCQRVMTQNTQKSKNFLVSAAVAGNVIHGTGFSNTARNSRTRFTLLISLGHTHNHQTQKHI